MKERRVGQADLWDAGRALHFVFEEFTLAGPGGREGKWEIGTERYRVSHREHSLAGPRKALLSSEGRTRRGGCQQRDRTVSHSRRETITGRNVDSRLSRDKDGSSRPAGTQPEWWRWGSCGPRGGGEEWFWMCLEETVNRSLKAWVWRKLPLSS